MPVHVAMNYEVYTLYSIKQMHVDICSTLQSLIRFLWSNNVLGRTLHLFVLEHHTSLSAVPFGLSCYWLGHVTCCLLANRFPFCHLLNFFPSNCGSTPLHLHVWVQLYPRTFSILSFSKFISFELWIDTFAFAHVISVVP